MHSINNNSKSPAATGSDPGPGRPKIARMDGRDDKNSSISGQTSAKDAAARAAIFQGAAAISSDPNSDEDEGIQTSIQGSFFDESVIGQYLPEPSDHDRTEGQRSPLPSFGNEFWSVDAASEGNRSVTLPPSKDNNLKRQATHEDLTVSKEPAAPPLGLGARPKDTMRRGTNTHQSEKPIMPSTATGLKVDLSEAQIKQEGRSNAQGASTLKAQYLETKDVLEALRDGISFIMSNNYSDKLSSRTESLKAQIENMAPKESYIYKYISNIEKKHRALWTQIDNEPNSKKVKSLARAFIGIVNRDIGEYDGLLAAAGEPGRTNDQASHEHGDQVPVGKRTELHKVDSVALEAVTNKYRETVKSKDQYQRQMMAATAGASPEVISNVINLTNKLETAFNEKMKTKKIFRDARNDLMKSRSTEKQAADHLAKEALNNSKAALRKAHDALKGASTTDLGKKAYNYYTSVLEISQLQEEMEALKPEVSTVSKRDALTAQIDASVKNMDLSGIKQEPSSGQPPSLKTIHRGPSEAALQELHTAKKMYGDTARNAAYAAPATHSSGGYARRGVAPQASSQSDFGGPSLGGSSSSAAQTMQRSQVFSQIQQPSTSAQPTKSTDIADAHVRSIALRDRQNNAGGRY